MANADMIKIVGAGAVSVAIMVLQTFLCLRKNKLFSIILPILCFGFSVVFTAMNFPSISGIVTSEAMIKCVKMFFLLNIPTAILALYAIVMRYFRNRFNKE